MGAKGLIGPAVALLVLLPATAPRLAAQQRLPETVPVAVTPTRTPVPEGEVVGSLDLITGGQIEAMAAPDVKPALALPPTILVEDSGGPAGVATLSLRGSTPQQVLVLLDGRRLAHAQSSVFDLNDLPVPVERVERIEVLPMPASALYGADALGGVVNVITRPPGITPALTAGYGVGGDGEERITGGAQFGVGKVGLRLDGRLHRGDGFRDNGDFDVKNLLGGLTVLPKPFGVDVRFAALERDTGVPGPAAFPTPEARRRESLDSLRADFSYLPAPSWDLRAGVFSERRTLRFSDPGLPGPAPTDPAALAAGRHENRSHGFEAQWDFSTGRGETFTFGGEWVADGVESDSVGDRDTERWGVYAQDQWRAGSWAAVGAIRRDEHSVYGERTSPSLTLAWQAEGGKLWASWARGYRLPSFDELYRDETFLQGNPDLKPESADGYEGGAEMGGSGGRLRLSVFRRDVQNLIRWEDPDGDLVFRPGNVPDARITGWEAQALYRLSAGLAIPVGYQRLTTEDRLTGEPLPGAVRSLWRAALQATGGSLTWSLEYAVTDRGRFQLRDEAWSYTVLNAALAWNHKLGSMPMRVSVRCDNLQDRDFETVEGYPMPGRSFFTEVRIGL